MMLTMSVIDGCISAIPRSSRSLEVVHHGTPTVAPSVAPSARTPTKWLVFTSAGDYSNHKQWLKGRIFDLWVVYYGTNANDVYEHDCDIYRRRKGGKFPNLFAMYQSDRHLLQQYDAIMVLDDDIAITGPSINRLFELREKYGLWVITPSFEPYHQYFMVLKRRPPYNRLRMIDMVEVNTPLIRRDILDEYMLNHYNSSLVGWGVDIALAHFMMQLNSTRRIAVSDEISCYNPPRRPDGHREINRLQSSAKRKRTWETFARQHKIPTRPPQNFFLFNGHYASIDTSRQEGPPEGFYVLSLQGIEKSRNNGRLDEFKRTWNDMCGKTHFTVCPGVLDDRRGFGITKAYVHCLDQMYRDGVEIAYVFEDDSQLVNASFCARDVRNKLVQTLPKDLFVLLLGGHHWKERSAPTGSLFTPLSRSYGTYAWAIQRTEMLSLRNFFGEMLLEKIKTLSPDIAWHAYAGTIGKVLYRNEPLFFKHKAGWSNTWKRRRKEIPIRHTPRVGRGVINNVYYVNLQDRPERKVFMEAWLSKANVTYTRVDGIRPTLSTKKRDPGCIRGKDDPSRCRGIRGIVASNLYIWEKLKPAGLTLVLEDDYFLDIKAAQSVITNVPRDWDIIRFNCRGNIPRSFEMITPTIFRTAHLYPERCKPTCSWYCGGAVAVLWRSDRMAKVIDIWSKQPYSDHDCRLTTSDLVSYCVQGVPGHFLRKTKTSIPKNK
jgi:hypothetical protein